MYICFTKNATLNATLHKNISNHSRSITTFALPLLIALSIIAASTFLLYKLKCTAQISVETKTLRIILATVGALLVVYVINKNLHERKLRTLHRALNSSAHPNIIALLVKAGASTIDNFEGYNSLQFALINKAPKEVIEHLLSPLTIDEKKELVNSKSLIEKHSAIELAIFSDAPLAVIELLLKAGGDLTMPIQSQDIQKLIGTNTSLFCYAIAKFTVSTDLIVLLSKFLPPEQKIALLQVKEKGEPFFHRYIDWIIDHDLIEILLHSLSAEDQINFLKTKNDRGETLFHFYARTNHSRLRFFSSYCMKLFKKMGYRHPFCALCYHCLFPKKNRNSATRSPLAILLRKKKRMRRLMSKKFIWEKSKIDGRLRRWIFRGHYTTWEKWHYVTRTNNKTILFLCAESDWNNAFYIREKSKMATYLIDLSDHGNVVFETIKNVEQGVALMYDIKAKGEEIIELGLLGHGPRPSTFFFDWFLLPADLQFGKEESFWDRTTPILEIGNRKMDKAMKETMAEESTVVLFSCYQGAYRHGYNLAESLKKNLRKGKVFASNEATPLSSFKYERNHPENITFLTLNKKTGQFEDTTIIY